MRREDFPIFDTNPSLVYLDSAATSQKPRQVIDAVSDFYMHDNANIHRGLYGLAERATEAYENARQTVANFIGAEYPSSIIFTRNATESVNLVRYTWADENLKEGDTILVTILEHHSNFVPWLDLCEKKGCKMKVVEMQDGELTGEMIAEQIDDSVKLIAVSGLSNALGIEIDLGPVMAVKGEAKILVDACQMLVHKKFEVGDADFVVFSGHKLYGPSGIGALYVKHDLMDDCKPFMFGGDMIKYVEVDGAEYMPVPQRYEAGTPNVSGAIGLAEAIKYMENIGMDEIEKHDRELCMYLEAELGKLDFVEVIGRGPKLSAVSFNVKGVHPHDVAQILADNHVAVRAGHHCAQPVMDDLGVPGTARASFGIYNDQEDVDKLLEALMKVWEVFGDE
jgi:cysteine desulfurase/selenocysteine lyase